MTEVIHQIFYSQCWHEVKRGDETAHILSHRTKYDEDKVRERLGDFMMQNLDWVKQVALPLLTLKKISIDEYIQTITQKQVPFDEIAIFIASRMYKIHTRIFVNDTVWSAKSGDALREEFQLELCYKGGMVFFDTAASDAENPTIAKENVSPLSVVNYTSEQLPNKCPDEAQPTGGAFFAPPTKPKPKPKKPKKTPPKKPRRNPSRPSRVQPARAVASRSDGRKPAKGRQTRTSAKAQLFSTKKGTLSVQTFGFRRKPQAKHRVLKCGYCMENAEKYKSQAAYNRHMASDHQNVKFKCRYCNSEYKTYNSRYKHMMVHKGFAHKCAVCDKVFAFPSLLQEHSRVHTDTGKLPCLNKDCRSTFTTKRALTQHMLVHNKEVYKCELCEDGEFDAPQYLRQHVRTKHLKNYKAYCGQMCPNPANRRRHQKTCERYLAQGKPKRKYLPKK